jgi:hypothetical protein
MRGISVTLGFAALALDSRLAESRRIGALLGDGDPEAGEKGDPARAGEPGCVEKRSELPRGLPTDPTGIGDSRDRVPRGRAPRPWVAKDSELVLSTAGQALGARDSVAERSVPAELA